MAEMRPEVADRVIREGARGALVVASSGPHAAHLMRKGTSLVDANTVKDRIPEIRAFTITEDGMQQVSWAGSNNAKTEVINPNEAAKVAPVIEHLQPLIQEPAPPQEIVQSSVLVGHHLLAQPGPAGVPVLEPASRPAPALQHIMLEESDRDTRIECYDIIINRRNQSLTLVMPPNPPTTFKFGIRGLIVIRDVDYHCSCAGLHTEITNFNISTNVFFYKTTEQLKQENEQNTASGDGAKG